MAVLALVFLCCAVFCEQALGRAISTPCNGPANLNNINISTNVAANIANAGANIGPSPLTITSATFTPLSNSLAHQAGLPGPRISEVVPNLKCGDISLTGDLPIGGTIKVSGCFPVYGMVAVDGVVPSSGSATVNTGSTFAAQLIENKLNSCPCAK